MVAKVDMCPALTSGTKTPADALTDAWNFVLEHIMKWWFSWPAFGVLQFRSLLFCVFLLDYNKSVIWFQDLAGDIEQRDLEDGKKLYLDKYNVLSFGHLVVSSPLFGQFFQLSNQFWSGLHMQVSWRLQIPCCRASDLLSGQRPTNWTCWIQRWGKTCLSVAPQGSASSLGIFLIGYWSQFGSQYCMPGDSFVVRWDDEVVTKRQLWYSVGVGSNPWIHGIFKRIFLVKNCGKAKEFTTLISSVCCLCTLPMCLVYELWDLTIGCRCSLHRFKGCSCCFGSQLYHREFLRHGCSLCSWVCWRSFQVSHSESLNWTSTVHFFWIGSYAIDYRCDGEFNCTANIK